MKTYYLILGDFDIAIPLLAFSCCKRLNMRIVHKRFLKFDFKFKEDPKGRFCWVRYRRPLYR